MEALVLVVDVGASAGAPGADGGTSFLAEALRCCDRILQRKLFADKCKDHVALVLVGTTDTQNPLHDGDADGDQYMHVTLSRRLAPVDWELVQLVRERVTAEAAPGDWLDGLLVAMDHLHQQSGVHKYKQLRIVLLSDFAGPLDADQLGQIVTGLSRMEVDLTVIGTELLDPDGEEADNSLDGAGEPRPGPSRRRHQLRHDGKPKTEAQLNGERVARQLLDGADGESFSFEQALPQLLFFHKRSARAAPWNAPLLLGDDLRIDIKAFAQVKKAAMPTWSKVSAENGALIKRRRTFQSADAGQPDPEEMQTVRAFRYGTRLVPVSDDVWDKLKYQSGAPKSIQILGFTAASNISPHLYQEHQTLQIIANGASSTEALSALIHALQETDMVAIARRAYNVGNVPRLGVLLPQIRHTHECLVFIQLPFDDDVRNPMFAPLPEPTEQQLGAVDQLIDAMDLTQEDAEVTADRLQPGNIVSPQFQRLYQVLACRALQGAGAIPAPDADLVAQLSPESALQTAAQGALTALAAACPLQEVTQPHQRRDTGAVVFQAAGDEPPPTTNGAAPAAAPTIGTVTPLEDFSAALTADGADIAAVLAQMQRVIVRLVDEAASHPAYGERALAALAGYRQHSVRMAPSEYNGWLWRERARLQLSAGVWTQLVERRLGPITARENTALDGLPDGDGGFYEQPAAAAAAQDAAEDEDLLDDL